MTAPARADQALTSPEEGSSVALAPISPTSLGTPVVGTLVAAAAVTPEQRELAKRTVAPALNEDEFRLFLYECNRRGVHPLDRLIVPQVHNKDNAQKRKVSFIVTVDYMRSRAAQTGEYVGSDVPVHEYTSADRRRPAVSTVTVWRLTAGMKCPFAAEARWDEYCPEEYLAAMWRKMPHVMLDKCAEALALRKAFPAELGGLYTREEMAQSGEVVDEPTPTAAAAPTGTRPTTRRAAKAPEADATPAAPYKGEAGTRPASRREVVNRDTGEVIDTTSVPADEEPDEEERDGDEGEGEGEGDDDTPELPTGEDEWLVTAVADPVSGVSRKSGVKYVRWDVSLINAEGTLDATVWNAKKLADLLIDAHRDQAVVRVTCDTRTVNDKTYYDVKAVALAD
jgi:phage recombination protein Bet